MLWLAPRVCPGHDSFHYEPWLVATCLQRGFGMPFRGAFRPDVISVAPGLSEGFILFPKKSYNVALLECILEIYNQLIDCKILTPFS